ncbi:ribonuclease H-like domain-containing protein [Tanacetum coccineum]
MTSLILSIICVFTQRPLHPRSHIHALRGPFWQKAMLEEYNALITNRTWVLVPRPANVNIVHSMWLFRHKFNADGSLSRYKARLVVNGRGQQLAIDCDETFSLIVKPATIRIVLSLGQPPSAWFQHFASYATRVGFQHSKTNSLLFIFHRGTDIAYLLLYVDDIILTASSTESLFLSQASYAKELLERAHMQNCNPCRTPVDTDSKLGPPCTLDYGLHLHVSNSAQLTTYTDAEWAGCPVTRRSTSGYCVFLGDNLLSWSAKRQATLSRSSAEAEYRGVANVVAETAWIQLDIQFVHDFVAKGLVQVMHVPYRYQYADIFTKGLPSTLFQDFRSSLNIRRPPAPTARVY